jgi:phage terminase large subunit GpA-like protein
MATSVEKKYEELQNALDAAFERASAGKGKERHANDLPFIVQPIITELFTLGPVGHVYQIRKKALESLNMDSKRAANEFLDIIVYAAAAYFYHSEEI